jgi:hypothetical protein
MGPHCAAAGRLAALGLADPQHVASDGLGAQVVVERQHAVDLGAREAEGLGDGADGGRGDPAEPVLDVLEHHEQAGGVVAVRIECGGDGSELISGQRRRRLLGDPSCSA